MSILRSGSHSLRNSRDLTLVSQMTMNSTAQLTFSDGETVFVPVEQGENILAAAHSMGITLAADCTEGYCGTCQAQLTAGTVAYDEPDELVLEQDERDAGGMLPCQAQAVSDQLEIALPYTRASVLPERKRKLVHQSVEQLSESVWQIRARSDGLAMFAYLPGQYVNIRVPGTTEERSFSVATPPQAEELVFLIRELPDGVMSRYLATAKIGDEWQIRGPFGVFYRREDRQAPLILMAGGTGLAPILAMLRDMRGRGEAERKIILSFGVTQQRDAFYTSELEQLHSDFPNLELHIAAVEHDASWPYLSGTVVDALAGYGPFDLDTRAYLCGPPAMVDAARPWLIEKGCKAESVFAEEFELTGA